MSVCPWTVVPVMPGAVVFTGTVTATNEELKSSPDKINEAPHDTWIIKVELADPAQFNVLLDAAAYEAFISEETGS